jgi:DNA polymerase-3 subunit delta
VILKSFIVEKNMEILKNFQAILIYGENIGIKDYIKESTINQNKDSEIIIYFEGELLKSKGILYKNVINDSLFNKKKLIFLQDASDKIYDEIAECLEKQNKDTKIYIFSEKLEKKSKLRNLFEKNKNLAIFPCYQDNERTLITYVNEELREFKGLTGEIVNLIIFKSSMDRRIIKSEIIKIKTYFLQKKINKTEILEILNIKKNISFDEIRDNALNGAKEKINQLLSEVELYNEDTFFYLNNLNYRVLKLQEIIEINNKNKNKPEEALEKLKPPIFWKDKPVIIQQLKKWNLARLTQLGKKICDTEILIKKNSYLRKDIIIKDLIIDLTKKASTTYS